MAGWAKEQGSRLRRTSKPPGPRLPKGVAADLPPWLAASPVAPPPGSPTRASQQAQRGAGGAPSKWGRLGAPPGSSSSSSGPSSQRKQQQQQPAAAAGRDARPAPSGGSRAAAGKDLPPWGAHSAPAGSKKQQKGQQARRGGAGTGAGAGGPAGVHHLAQSPVIHVQPLPEGDLFPSMPPPDVNTAMG